MLKIGQPIMIVVELFILSLFDPLQNLTKPDHRVLRLVTVTDWKNKLTCTNLTPSLSRFWELCVRFRQNKVWNRLSLSQKFKGDLWYIIRLDIYFKTVIT